MTRWSLLAGAGDLGNAASVQPLILTSPAQHNEVTGLPPRVASTKGAALGCSNPGAHGFEAPAAPPLPGDGPGGLDLAIFRLPPVTHRGGLSGACCPRSRRGATSLRRAS
jgi:hypothetical protein